MKARKRIWPLIAALVVFAGPGSPGGARADDVSVTAQVSPSVVSLGSEAVLTVTVRGKFRRSAEPTLPEIDGLEFYQSGTSQNLSFVNGQMSSALTFNYTLVAGKEGSYTIAPITFTIGDQEYTANPVTLEVTAASSSVPTPPAASATPGSAPPGGETPDEDQSIFITATVDRDTVYVNQQVTWTLGYYSDGRVGLLRSPNYSPPQAEGFWVEDLPPQNKYYTQLHNRRYLVNEIKRAYFPTAPGVYTIGKARVDVVIDDTRRRGADDFFSRSLLRSFGDSRTLLTEEREVVVLPLPKAGKPDNFSGIVARQMRLSIAADKQVVQVGEPVNVTVEINGVGNVKTIAAPPLPESDRYKIYESGSKSDTFKKDYVVSGRKQYDYVLIPQVEGKWSVPELEVSYFDPVGGVYRTATSHAIPLDVQPGTKEEGRKVIYAGGGDDIDVISRDIRYIHPVPSSLALSSSKLYHSRVYAALHLLPLLAVAVSLVVERKRRRLRDDVVFARSTRALREATRRLDLGERHFTGGDIEGGYSALAGAVTGFFSDKMNTPPAGLTAGEIEAFLRSRGVDDDVVEQVRRILAESDAARFAGPAGTSADRGAEAVRRASELLKTIERRYLS
jgi:hypothetical protein